MTYIGPVLSLPIGFAVFTIIIVLLFMVASEVWWRLMAHFPEDEEEYNPDREHFEIQADDFKKQADEVKKQ
ncbi:MAG: hypothetical protein LUB63_05655 [Oscillospiraceae bacterium]|nr:hypothetical protein [Oscillospiraceae bacterium]